ncbi:MAG TPA: DUF3631 domain-containing protein, partial [Solirubrobacteraceae bacterium]|nr:DUF3631 domain-containing protein [Solirubrobacteraceae bacterium]
GRGLGKLLKPFGIPRQQTVRHDGTTAKGYKREWFVDCWDRYCTDTNEGAQHDVGPDSASTRDTTDTTALQSQKTEISDRTQKPDVSDSESAENPHSNADVSNVSDKNGQPGAGHTNGSLAEQAVALFGEHGDR